MSLGARFLGQGVKKGNFWTPCQKRKFWLITEKLFFWYFCVFYFFFLGFFLFFGGGLFCFFFFCFFLVFLRVRSKGPPHLVLNPPCFLLFGFVFVFFFPFLSLLLIDKKPCFPPRKGHFLFSFFVSLSFSLNLFWPPPFSISLSLSLSFSCLSFFLLVFLFAFFLFLVFVSFHISFFFAFVSWKEQHENFQLQFVFLKYFIFLLVSCLAFSFQSFFFLCFFLILSYVFCSTSMFLVSKKQSWKTPSFGQKGVATKRVFLWTCVLENVKSYHFSPFCKILVDVQKTLQK